ncbi:hypothetical protein CDD83_910 [Cordyceps sp. RAO-2017]|nr:hypothetical protein CDD83_910 [Cordyceps sp. RAO-2017]
MPRRQGCGRRVVVRRGAQRGAGMASHVEAWRRVYACRGGRGGDGSMVMGQDTERPVDGREAWAKGREICAVPVSRCHSTVAETLRDVAGSRRETWGASPDQKSSLPFPQKWEQHEKPAESMALFEAARDTKRVDAAVDERRETRAPDLTRRRCQARPRSATTTKPFERLVWSVGARPLSYFRMRNSCFLDVKPVAVILSTVGRLGRGYVVGRGAVHTMHALRSAGIRMLCSSQALLCLASFSSLTRRISRFGTASRAVEENLAAGRGQGAIRDIGRRDNLVHSLFHRHLPVSVVVVAAAVELTVFVQGSERGPTDEIRPSRLAAIRPLPSRPPCQAWPSPPGETPEQASCLTSVVIGPRHPSMAELGRGCPTPGKAAFASWRYWRYSALPLGAAPPQVGGGGIHGGGWDHIGWIQTFPHRH